MEINLDMIQTITLAVVIYYFGNWVRSKVDFLDRFCIPAPVIGGILFAFLNLIMRESGVLFLNFDTSLQSPAMIVFFTTVGLGASLELVKKGGIQVALFWLVATFIALGQNAISIVLSKILHINPLMALLSGSISMIGGHGTGAAFGQLFEQQYGIEGALTAAMAAATFGLVIGGLIGGPIGKKLIEKNNLNPQPEQYENKQKGEQEERLNYQSIFKTFMVILIAMSFGSVVEKFFDSLNFTLPAYISAMIIAALILNLGEATGKWEINSKANNLIGSIGLNIFLSMALMSLRLWELADIAGPMLIILIAQAIFMALMAYFVVFKLMNKDYDGAVLSGGICGFGMGATPNGVANMEALVDKFGSAPRAFFVLPIVGAFLIDFTNAIIITTVANLIA
ncbi:sodium/glutamate symporter [Halanaerobium praevalens]|uniref:Sodium/glutamate symporter n=1 Tax=Halanaerobium praevalens (strain ATCC 33744 / DSM 2228 / GSL) TaxID=572479 RepID=E3DQQ8_HALPG|nr:sodium/glutamate symporter [Halanaerobium praevalens]ADO77969.1 sodium/glutamate symporter [Halanaerobium praevalens DSM 2228]